MNLRARCTWIGVGASTAVADRDRFARPRLNDGAVALCAAHALWRHSRRQDSRARNGRVVAWTDLLVHAAGFGLVSAAATSEDQFDMITNWVYAVALFDVADAGLALDPREAGLVGLLTAAIYTTLTSRKGHGTVRSVALANAGRLLLFAGAGIWGGRILRRGESEFEAINVRYRSERAEAARQSEIDASRQHLVRAVQRAADDLGELMVRDRPAARRRAAAIATQLRAVLGRPDNALGARLNDAILGAVVDAAGDGLTVETTFRIEADVEPLLIEPAVAALRAALRNVIDHASTDRAVLRVVVDAKHVQVTLRDRGRGRDDLQASDLASVNDALTGVTALVEVSSSNERGTRIQITVPT